MPPRKWQKGCTKATPQSANAGNVMEQSLLSPIFTSFPLDFLFAGSVSFADSVPQFGIVALLHSQARLQFSLPYWAYYGLFPPLAAAFVRPFFLREKGGFWPGNFLRLCY